MLPRLYPYLSGHVALDDLRDRLDITARLCVTLLLATVISTALLFTHGWWLLVPAATTILAWVAYRSAVQAAIAYGKQVAVAFDLHRFDMLRGLHYLLPPNQRLEVEFNKRLSPSPPNDADGLKSTTAPSGPFPQRAGTRQTGLIEVETFSLETRLISSRWRMVMLLLK